jgi:hypothetical protein
VHTGSPSFSTPPHSTEGVIIGVVVAVILLVILVSVGIVITLKCYKRERGNKT